MIVPAKRNVIICMPVGGAEPVAGSTTRRCEVCDRLVWVSPASIASLGQDGKIICQGCLPTGAQIQPLTAEQLLEIAAELARRRRRKP